jgi:crotonobetainyl-CoA:carnitine CoA-transferase CaiB-like acyl-CoA transferase
VQPCHTLDTLPLDRHLQAVGLIAYEQHPTEGRTASIRSSIRVDDATLPRREPAQPRGADTRTLLTELGYAPGAIDDLLSSGAAQAPAAR